MLWRPGKSSIMSHVPPMPSYLKFVSAFNTSIPVPVSVSQTFLNTFVSGQAKVRAKSASSFGKRTSTLRALGFHEQITFRNHDKESHLAPNSMTPGAQVRSRNISSSGIRKCAPQVVKSTGPAS
jgi:hypothetical protein